MLENIQGNVRCGMKNFKVNILGTEYTVEKHDFNDPELKNKNRMGYCFYDAKQIVYEDLDTDDDWKNESVEVKENREKTTLRHEIFHAFLFESGLAQNSDECRAWAVNEEMIDWFAIQSPKIYKVFAELDIL